MWHIIAFGGIATGYVVLGQVEMAAWADLLSNLGIVGVLAWYLWYTTATTIPKIVQDFREEAREARVYDAERTDKLLAGMAKTRTVVNELQVVVEKHWVEQGKT